MKAYTDIEQSKKLAKILPLESADGFWQFHTEWGGYEDSWEGYEDYPSAVPYLEFTRYENEWKEEKQDMPCWSLAALLDIIPQEILDGEYIINITGNDGWTLMYNHYELRNHSYFGLSTSADNLIDVCVKTILKLYELNLL